MNEKSRHLPSLNALRAFEVTSRHLSFRAAAEEIGVTQSAVAQLVRGLETDLGVKLFLRLPKQLALTDEGRAYGTDIRRAFQLFGEATLAIRPVQRSLTISATPTFAAKWLLPRLPAFMAAHPELELRILASESLASFQTDGVDIAVRQGQPPFGPGLVSELLFEQRVIAVCSPAYQPAAAEALKKENLDALVLLRDTHNLWPEFIGSGLRLATGTEAKGVRFNHTSLAIDAAIAGQGITLASDFLVEADLAAGRLVKAFDVSIHGRHDFHVVAPREPKHPGATNIVRNWLVAQRGQR
ncbi:LysR family transcriptional regulator [Rhizobium sp. S-51]|uniref:LysR family transcriptional regulator n=1 Tax=Rhizobium terricola TaxID=2728849 RepID=A0A7Y0AWM8_9HYPH|nr:LysR substrate-binding domain-containing protein [Rhizobium terricola]NML74845.1 LysR family transcriptional regulator [Rhizobium terricola]